ncbi:MAG: SCO family protein [Alphaproteobacteria bacterium]|nr:SCO family protein [Alphaproteobacteria bacterium]
MNNRMIRTLTLCLLGVLLGSGIAWYQINGEARSLNALTPTAGTAEPAMTVGGPFALTDHFGNPATEKSFPGLKLAFFGFTYCPDVCPAGLKKMSLALQELGDDANQIAPLFITVDPERDTPDVLKEYVGLYDDRLTGLTGTPEQIKTTIESFRVYAAKAEGADPENYMMNHSGYTYLLDDNGVMLTVFGPDESPAAMAKEIRDYLKQS